MKAGEAESERVAVDLVDQARALLATLVHDPVVVNHVREMHDLLSRWQVRTSVLIATYLLVPVHHELIPDAELVARFGSRTVQLARLAVKLIFVDTRPPAPGSRRSAPRIEDTELLRGLFVYAYTDFEAVLLTVANQIATASQYDEMNETERQAWAQRNQAVYIPLLEMLGLWSYHSELGNISLYILNPALYEQLDDQVRLYRERNQQLYDALAPVLMSLMETHQIPDPVFRLHLTTPASLFKRIEKYQRRGEKIGHEGPGMPVIDLIVADEPACYLALGLIHNTWRPAQRQHIVGPVERGSENRFRDYIAAPRYNGYRCLITTVLCELPTLNTDGAAPGQPTPGTPALQPVEFRIRTHRMETVNAFGIAAAMFDPQPVRNTWWTQNNIREIIKPGTTGVLTPMSEIAVFTPGGEVIYPLPPGCTMLDLAFKIHSSLGPYAKSFFINGRPAAADQVIRHRDLVEVEYDLHYPGIQPEWEELARLNSTRTGIRRFLRQRERAPHRGRQRIDDVLAREAEIYRMRFPAEKIESTLKQIARDYHCATVEALYIRILDNTISPDEVVARMIEAELVGHIVLATGESFPPERIRIAQTWMQDKEPQKWERTSRVVPGVEIVGRFSGRDNNRLLTVYRADARQAPTGDQRVELRWRAAGEQHDAIELTVRGAPRSHVIGMVLNAIYGAVGEAEAGQKMVIHRFHAESDTGQLIVNAIIEIPLASTLNDLQDRLAAVRRSGYITDFKIWQLFPGQKLLIAGKSDKRQQNPYTFKQVGNLPMFYGRREELQNIIQEIEVGHLVVLYGQKRIGKTSLLNQLAEVLPQSCDAYPILFDTHSLAEFDAISFLSGLVDAALEQLQSRLRRGEDRRRLRLNRPSLLHDPFRTFALWVYHTQQLLNGTRLVFMIDEFTRAEEECKIGSISTAFFDGLQWLAGNQNIGFVLCVHDHLMLRADSQTPGMDTRSWGLLQRGKPIRLDALDRASAARLVKQPLENLIEIDDTLVNRILQLTNCHPYLIQVICYQLIEYLTIHERQQATPADLDKVAIEIMLNGDHYFSHFRSRVSVHDWDVLRVIASLTEDDDESWATSSAIRAAMSRLVEQVDTWNVSRSLGELKYAGMIEARDLQSQPAYRIPVGIFQMWLKQVVTSLLVSRDLRAPDFRTT